jgi:hypothetical protein
VELEGVRYHEMTTNASSGASTTPDEGPGAHTETCDLCGAVLDTRKHGSRLDAVVAHFEAVHVDIPRE